MRRVGVLVALIFLSRPVAANPWVSFGAKAGLYSSATTETPAGWRKSSFRTGFAGGVYMNWALSRSFSLQPEVLYVMKGLTGSTEGWADYSARFDYIELPLLAKFTLAGARRLCPYVIAGPNLGINLSSKVDVDYAYSWLSDSNSGTSDWSAVMNKTEICFSFGVGCTYAIGLGGITTDARFDLGLTKVYKGGAVTTETGDYEIPGFVHAGNSRNLGFALLVGYNF
jgi:hypothetical protein